MGKADPSLLENVEVVDKNSGKSYPLEAFAQVNVKDGSTLSLSVFDQSKVRDVTQAIVMADLGLNPMQTGSSLLITVPKYG